MADNEAAYGFDNLQQFFASRISQQNVDSVMEAAAVSTAAYTRMANALFGTVMVRTTIAKERVYLPTGGEMQPLDEFGVPLVTRNGTYYDVAYPMKHWGTAYGRNRITRVQETIADINRDQLDAEAKDKRALRRHALAALFTNTTRDFDDPLLGTITVQPLAISSDNVEYVRTTGDSSTAQHYLAQSGSIADNTNPYSTIETLLKAHPSNAGRRIVVHIASNLVATTKALTDFYPVADPDVRPGSSTDILLPSGTDLRGFGDTVLGKVGGSPGVWVVENAAIPSDYMLALVDGRPPLAMREYPEAELQGLQFSTFDEDGFRVARRYVRDCGFGVRDRVSAAVMRIGNASYAIPSGYTAPLAQ